MAQEPSKSTNLLKCPRCSLAGKTVSDCSGGGVIKCPTPVPVDAQKDAIIECRVCNITIAVSAPGLLKGKNKPTAAYCRGQTDSCKAFVRSSGKK